MATVVQSSRLAAPRGGLAEVIAAWLPLGVLPPAAGMITWQSPAWVHMWAVAIAIYAGFKWATVATCPHARDASPARVAGYLLLWTGMNAEAFLGRPALAPPRWSQWAWAAWQSALGVWLLLHVAPPFIDDRPLLAGWLALTGVVSVLHFGLSQFLSLLWRSAGVNAQHIMHKPLLAASLADFWGRRWNLAFRDLVHRFVLLPLVPRVGGAWAMIAVLFVSGLIHDVVISLAAGGGWGRPTLYFLIQGIAQLVERSRMGRAIGLARGLVGRLYSATVVLAPVGLLFHPPFIVRVVLPMIECFAGTRL
jgi:alginate O-acetyltransferase complex protein AlgI